MAVGGKSAGNALTDGVAGSELGNFASNIPGLNYLDFTGQRKYWF
jgi:hypothetical protein